MYRNVSKESRDLSVEKIKILETERNLIRLIVIIILETMY